MLIVTMWNMFIIFIFLTHDTSICALDDPCAKNTCTQICRPTRKGPECYCNKGYLLEKDNKTCVDIDECNLFNRPCSQICNNSIGSYKCSCIEGYNLENVTCKAAGIEPLMIFSMKEKIGKLYLRSNKFIILSKKVSALDVDPIEKRIFFLVRSNQSAIHSSNMNATVFNEVLSNGLMVPRDIAVDYVARNLYITDYGLKQILVCKMDGTVCHALHSLNISSPNSVALDPTKGLLYWSDWGENSTGIYRSGMDGSRRSVLVSGHMKWPKGITIDHTTNRLYWIDAKLRTIEYTTLDGLFRVVVKNDWYRPYSVTVFEDALYWTNLESQSVLKCNKFNFSNVKDCRKIWNSDDKDQPILNVHVYHPVHARRVYNPCRNNSCSHMCLLAPSDTFKCVCPPGFYLARNGETCVLDDAFPVIFVKDNLKIYVIRPEAVGSTALTERPIPHIDKIGRIVYDWRTKTLYVADIKTPAIYTVNVSTSLEKDLVKKDLGIPQDLAFDWKSENLYWVDYSKGTVEVITTKSHQRSVLIKGLTKPTAIALKPQIGRMFISTIGDEPFVAMYNMDGTNQVILNVKTTSAMTIALHPSASLLYWTDSHAKSISYLDYEIPRNEPNVLLSGLENVISIAISEKYIYWTDIKNNVLNYRLHNGSLRYTFSLPGARHEFAPRNVLFSETPLISKSFEFPCSLKNGGCSHICLTREIGRTCACVSGMLLSKDGVTCITATDRDTTYLTLLSEKVAAIEKNQIRILQNLEEIELQSITTAGRAKANLILLSRKVTTIEKNQMRVFQKLEEIALQRKDTTDLGNTKEPAPKENQNILQTKQSVPMGVSTRSNTKEPAPKEKHNILPTKQSVPMGVPTSSNTAFKEKQNILPTKQSVPMGVSTRDSRRLSILRHSRRLRWFRKMQRAKNHF